jgi:hypothetical protein
MDLVGFANRIAEPIAVDNAVGVDIDRDMPADAVLIVEDVGPQPRMRGKHLIEHGAHAVAWCRLHRAAQVSLQIGGECNASHRAMLLPGLRRGEPGSLQVGTRTIQVMPKRSANMPKLEAKNVFPNGICTWPPSPNAENSRLASASSDAVMVSANP